MTFQAAVRSPGKALCPPRLRCKRPNADIGPLDPCVRRVWWKRKSMLVDCIMLCRLFGDKVCLYLMFQAHSIIKLERCSNKNCHHVRTFGRLEAIGEFRATQTVQPGCVVCWRSTDNGCTRRLPIPAKDFRWLCCTSNKVERLYQFVTVRSFLALRC